MRRNPNSSFFSASFKVIAIHPGGVNVGGQTKYRWINENNLKRHLLTKHGLAADKIAAELIKSREQRKQDKKTSR